MLWLFSVLVAVIFEIVVPDDKNNDPPKTAS